MHPLRCPRDAQLQREACAGSCEVPLQRQISKVALLGRIDQSSTAKRVKCATLLMVDAIPRNPFAVEHTAYVQGYVDAVGGTLAAVVMVGSTGRLFTWDSFETADEMAQTLADWARIRGATQFECEEPRVFAPGLAHIDELVETLEREFTAAGARVVRED